MWKKLNDATIYEINDLSHYVIDNGININNLLKYINNKIINSTILNDNNKQKLLIEILNISARLLEKSDEYLQIIYLFSIIKG